MTRPVAPRLQLCLVGVSSVANNVPVDHVTRFHAGSSGNLPTTGFLAPHTAVDCAFLRPSQYARATYPFFLSVPDVVAQIVTVIYTV